jgi:GDP-mannose 6-dehydrogenase
VRDLVLATRKTRIGVLGLTFKVGTDDTRESPALILTRTLLEKGCEVWAYEPDLDPNGLVGANRAFVMSTFPNFVSQLVDSTTDLARRADVLIITKSDPKFMELIADLHPGHTVIDLPGFLGEHVLPCPYIAVC